jgi:hypothetical protein
VPHLRITRWRRGSLLTVYRFETQGSTQYWFYLPFNIGFGFSVPTGEKDEVEIPDESAASRARTPEDSRYWN